MTYRSEAAFAVGERRASDVAAESGILGSATTPKSRPSVETTGAPRIIGVESGHSTITMPSTTVVGVLSESKSSPSIAALRSGADRKWVALSVWNTASPSASSHPTR